MEKNTNTIVFESIAKAKKQTGLTYIGMVNNSTKHEKAFEFNEMVYTIYLSPANKSGYEVCPKRTNECTLLCLDESGRNRMDTKLNRINKSRIKKTKLFFENREFFVRWVIEEIKQGKKKADDLGFEFSVRLNNTSDLSPEIFYINDNGVKRNILEIFPDIQFYDYTKVSNRFKLLDKYPNYDLTFSYSGENMNECTDVLSGGNRVAMVFKKVPETYLGYQVVDGDKYDMRYRDDKNVIIGLKFKKVRNKLEEKYKFVIQ
jgi:hypothetical protein